MKKVVLLMIFVIPMFSGCFLLDIIVHTKIHISFELGPAGKGLSASKAISSAANEIIYLNINDNNRQIKRKLLETGENFIAVPKNGIYLIGLVHNPGLEKGITAKSISNAISMVGNIKIVTNGLNSLPVSGDSADSLNLGDLNEENSSFGSVIPEDNLSDDLGYTADILKEYANYDDTTMKFLNPDINQNGIYDSEEGIEWTFQVNYNIELTVSADDFDNDTIETNVNAINPWVSFQLSHNGSLDPQDGFDYQGTNLNENIRLYFPENIDIEDIEGNKITYRACYYSDKNQFGFDTPPMSITSPLPPYNGNYILKVYSNNYYINNVNFLKPSDNYENMIVIIYKHVIDESGNVLSFSWKWKLIKDGQYIDADPDIVKLRIKDLQVKWSYPGGTFNTNFNDGTEYSTQIENYWENGTFIPPAGTNAYDKELVCTFTDNAGNFFWFGQTNNITIKP